MIREKCTGTGAKNLDPTPATTSAAVKEIKVTVHCPKYVSDAVKQQKINRIYDILAQKNS